MQLFLRVSTQWIDGMSGPTGLSYPSVYPLLDRLAAAGDDWDALFDDVRCIERAALAKMNEKTD